MLAIHLCALVDGWHSSVNAVLLCAHIRQIGGILYGLIHCCWHSTRTFDQSKNWSIYYSVWLAGSTKSTNHLQRRSIHKFKPLHQMMYSVQANCVICSHTWRALHFIVFDNSLQFDFFNSFFVCCWRHFSVCVCHLLRVHE